MMLSLFRVLSDAETTIGKMVIDFREPVCWWLEDQRQAQKVYGETRIPAGTYSLGLRAHGGFHRRYSERFSDFHQGMIEVLDVPGFTDVLMHIGNEEHETDGCPLSGLWPVVSRNQIERVDQSTAAYKLFYDRVIDDVKAGSAYLQIFDFD